MVFIDCGRQRRHLVGPVSFCTSRIPMSGKPLHHTQVMPRFQQVRQHTLPDRLGTHYPAGIQPGIAAFDVLGNDFSFHRLTPDTDQ